MLELSGVAKAFGDTVALEEVSFSAAPGEIVGIVGENGAGKTTLMRIIAGELIADAGAVRAPARTGFVHQHFMLVGDFSVAENLALTRRDGLRLRGRQTLDHAAVAIIAATGLSLPDVTRRAEALAVGEKSKLELIKAIAGNPALLILDEPTSVLTPPESAELFAVIRRLAAAGTTVLFISHKLREVLDIAQRVVVMRHGRVVVDGPAATMNAEKLASAMIEIAGVTPQARPPRGAGAVALECQSVVTERLDGVTFEVRAGEIVAIAGVAGNGQADLEGVLRGLIRPSSGRISIQGRTATSRELLRARSVGHVPEDRTRDGVVAQMSIAENVALAASRWRRSDAVRRATQLISLYGIRARGPLQPAGSLSGGNQQKVILARELDRRPQVIVAAEPTRGLDFDATRFIHEQLRAAAGAGAAILLITSDLDEALALADHVHAIYRGRLSERMPSVLAGARLPQLMAGVA